MKSKPLVSVIIPFYNLGEYLKESINSVLKQSYKYIEVVVVNDGSTDTNSIKILNHLKSEYKDRVKFIDQKNSGVAAARNHGIMKTSGEYICCLDCDDIYHPQFISEAVKIAEKDKTIGVVTSWLKQFGLSDYVGKPKNYDLVSLLTDNCIHVASLFQRKAWKDAGKYDTKLQGYQDWDFWIKIMSKGYQWKVVEEVLFFYRVRKNSMVTTSNKNRLNLINEIIKNNFDIYSKYWGKIILKLNQNLIASQSFSNDLSNSLKIALDRISAKDEYIKELENARDILKKNNNEANLINIENTKKSISGLNDVIKTKLKRITQLEELTKNQNERISTKDKYIYELEEVREKFLKLNKIIKIKTQRIDELEELVRSQEKRIIIKDKYIKELEKIKLTFENNLQSKNRGIKNSKE